MKDILYKDGAEGMIKWCNEKVYIPIYHKEKTLPEWVLMGNMPDTINPETGRSFLSMWKEHQKILHEALIMENGTFYYRHIIFCWQRGEGASTLSCLIILWKYFNFINQKILLGASTKDQINFLHYYIIKDIIRNSPELIDQVGEKNILEKEIRLTDEAGFISLIRPIPSFSGVLSNCTGFSFSVAERFNPKLFIRISGATCNINNVLGIVDIMVSTKKHLLWLKKREKKGTYFSYRFSETGTQGDYWHPNMTQAQLNKYKELMREEDFKQYFQNIWTSGDLEIDKTIKQFEERGMV